jgi:tRNA threonylcarbamoyladenosine biosynthesis protein TsaB
MIVLGFDTATPATAIGLTLADGSFTQARDDPSPGARPGHATRLLPIAARLLAEAGLGWADLERIAVGVGPGTFTGLRVGLATARGLAQSLDVELVGVSSLRALALGAARACAEPGDRVLAVLDARRGEVFAAVYALGDRRAEAALARPRVRAHDDHDSAPTELSELASPRVLAPMDLDSILSEAPISASGSGSAAVSGSGAATRWLAAGDGALRYRAALASLGVEVVSEDSPAHRIGGEAICELATLAPSPAQAIETVLPDYLRRPDAEIALEQRVGATAQERR